MVAHMLKQEIFVLRQAAVIIFTGILSLMSCQHAFAITNVVIAQTEDFVPGENGQFRRFSLPKINSSDNVVFKAQLMNTSDGENNDSGIYRIFIPSSLNASIVNLEQIVREAEIFTASGQSYQLNDMFGAAYLIRNAPVGNLPLIGEFNNLAVMLPLVPGSGERGDSIIAVESDGAFTLVAEAGAEVESGNGVYREFSVFSLVGLSSNNDLTFFSALDNTENGSEDNTAYFKRYNSNLVQEIIRKGDSGSVGPITNPAGLVSNDFDEGVFVGGVPNEASNNNSGIYKSSGSSYSIVVHESDTAPSQSPDIRIFSQLEIPRINNEQEIGFIGTVRDENGFSAPFDNGLFLSRGNSITALLLQGQLTPDGSATFLSFVNYARVLPNLTMNDAAQFALRLGVVGDLTQEIGQGTGIFRVSETEVTEIARKGDVYEDGNLRNFANPVINNDGLVVFHADLQLTEFIVTDEGNFFPLEDILIISDGIQYETIERGGREYNGKIVRDILFDNNGNGQANGLGDSGKVTYAVSYEDGTQSLHVWAPELGWRLDEGEGDWDDVNHWHFGSLPNAFTDVVLDLDYDLDLFGPREETNIKSMSLGGNTGTVHFTLRDSIFNVSDGMTILAPAILSGQGTLASSVLNNSLIEIFENQSLIISGNTTNNGVVKLNPESELHFMSLFKGSEPIQGSGTVIFNGELQLGDEPKLLTVEGRVNFASTSMLKIKVAGVQRGESYDAIDVGLSVNLGGTLSVELLPNVVLAAGDVFEVLRANEIVGEFENIILPNVEGQNITVSLNQTASKVELVVTQNTVVVNAPEAETSSGGGSTNMGFIVFLLMTIVCRLSFLRRRLPTVNHIKRF